jgi:hypothetical protein
MLQCPFCHFNNEDGALFCEQCKSDLAGAVGTAQPAPAEAMPLEAVPVEAVPVEAVAEAVPYEAIPVASAEPMPLEAHPLPAEPVAAIPVALEPTMPEPAPHVMETVPHTPPPAPQTPPTPSQAAPVAPVPAPPVSEPPPAAAPPLASTTPPPAAAAPAAAAPTGLPPGAQPRLLVLRGQKRNVEYPVYEGLNFIGRADEKPVDIDLEDQEPPDRIWCSRQHACLSFENDQLALEDLNSANGTYVNRTRIYPGQKRTLVPNDIIQIGNVQLKVIV